MLPSAPPIASYPAAHLHHLLTKPVSSGGAVQARVKACSRVHAAPCSQGRRAHGRVATPTRRMGLSVLAAASPRKPAPRMDPGTALEVRQPCSSTSLVCERWLGVPLSLTRRTDGSHLSARAPQQCAVQRCTAPRVPTFPWLRPQVLSKLEPVAAAKVLGVLEADAAAEMLEGALVRLGGSSTYTHTHTSLGRTTPCRAAADAPLPSPRSASSGGTCRGWPRSCPPARRPQPLAFWGTRQEIVTRLHPFTQNVLGFRCGGFPNPRRSVSRRAAERCHRTGRERMGSSTLQTLQDPVLLLLGSAFVAAFQTLRWCRTRVGSDAARALAG
jgi:hypothetical protein